MVFHIQYVSIKSSYQSKYHTYTQKDGQNTWVLFNYHMFPQKTRLFNFLEPKWPSSWIRSNVHFGSFSSLKWINFGLRTGIRISKLIRFRFEKDTKRAFLTKFTKTAFSEPKSLKKDDFFEGTYNSKNVFNKYTKSIYYFNTNLNHLFVQEYAAGSSTYLSLYSSNDVSILLYD